MNDIWQRAKVMRENGGRLPEEKQTPQERAMNYQRLHWPADYFEVRITCQSSFQAFAEQIKHLCHPE